MVKILSTSLILLAIIAITYGRSTEYKIDDLELSNEAKTYQREDEAGFEASLHLNIGLNSNSEDGNTGEDNTGEGNIGKGNTGEDNTGKGNTGEDNTGEDNTGEDNTGEDNTGEGDIDGVKNLQGGNGFTTTPATTTPATTTPATTTPATTTPATTTPATTTPATTTPPTTTPATTTPATTTPATTTPATTTPATTTPATTTPATTTPATTTPATTTPATTTPATTTPATTTPATTTPATTSLYSGTWCDGQIPNIVCGLNKVIEIQSSFYGRKDNVTCTSHPSHFVPSGGCSEPRALSIAQARCDGQKVCDIAAELEDPCFGTFKYLTVSWRCK